MTGNHNECETCIFVFPPCFDAFSNFSKFSNSEYTEYQGSTDSEWPFVNDKDYGYLQLQIDNNDGNVISTHFYVLGGLIH